jgi:hypothetical protein
VRDLTRPEAEVSDTPWAAPTTYWWADRPAGSPGTQTTADICGGLLCAAQDRLKCHLASAWSIDPVNGARQNQVLYGFDMTYRF